MRSICLSCVIFILMGISTLVHAQGVKDTPNVKIIFRDSLTSQPIEFVTVFLFDSNDSITPIAHEYSNHLGAVFFNVAKNRKYRVIASFFGEEIYRKEFMLDERQPLIEQNVLASLTKQLKEVVVQAKPISTEKGKMTFQILSAGLGNALAAYNTYDVLSRTPRVQVVDGQILVDGKPAEIQIDGVKRTNAHEILSLMSAEDIRKIEVQFGRSASMSGDVAGGVVNIVRKERRGFSSSFKNTLLLTGKSLNSSPTTALMQKGNVSLMYGTDK